MHWYLVHTKLGQEKCAPQNLDRQGYQCYLPTRPSEKLCQGRLIVTDEPLFPRYLFIRLGQGDSAKSWAPIRTTKGVSRLVSFGVKPARVDDALIGLFRTHKAIVQGTPRRLFKPGDQIRLTEGTFAGIEGVYHMPDGEHRVMALIKLLSKSVAVCVAPAQFAQNELKCGFSAG